MAYPCMNYSLGGTSEAWKRRAAAYAQYEALYAAQNLDNPYGQNWDRKPAPQIMQPPMHWSGVLGVSRAASKAEINKSYRAKAKLLHADVVGGNDEAMKRLNAAREQAIRELSGK